MANFSDFLEGQILNTLFRSAAAYKPAAIYIGLWTSSLTDASTGASAGEVSGGSYARQQVTQADANWTAPGAAGTTDNVNAIAFPQATANWGLVTDVAILDASTGGNILFFGTLTTSKQVNNGDTFRFNVGDLDITLA